MKKKYLLVTSSATFAATAFILMSAKHSDEKKVRAIDHAKAAKYAPANPLRNAYYGDLHLHTALSFDASAFGTRILPDASYKYAKGDSVVFMGKKIKRNGTLDFLAVTDHSEYMGVFNDMVVNDNAYLANTEYAKKMRDEDSKVRYSFFREIVTYSLVPGKTVDDLDRKDVIKSAWDQQIAAANNNYEPGKFTTFIAYEWTSAPGATLHRNVFFRGSKVPQVPYSSLDSQKPEDLWSFLEANRKQGIEGFCATHNSNISDGMAFQLVDSYGKTFTKEYNQRRASNELFVEISQNKGQSETHPLLSPDDEFANFEQYTGKTRFGVQYKIHGSFVREAYGNGLAQQANTGVNPFKFGIVGASDYHSGITTSQEYNYFGQIANTDSNLRVKVTTPIAADNSPAGGHLTGAWAEENTRDAIFDAFKRKETFATSGTKLQFRFFGGWGFDKNILKKTDWVKDAYAKGVPMGGDLPAKPGTSKAPVFVLWAIKDPNSGNLDRLQIVKVSLKDGKPYEKIFNVALADGRKPDPVTGKVTPIGNTVDAKTATYMNTIGDTELGTVWTDPEFDPSVASLYYLRVLEIPTPRWSTIHAVASKQALPENLPKTIQERGWSSPIWYTPLASK